MTMVLFGTIQVTLQLPAYSSYFSKMGTNSHLRLTAQSSATIPTCLPDGLRFPFRRVRRAPPGDLIALLPATVGSEDSGQCALARHTLSTRERVQQRRHFFQHRGT